MLPVGSPVAFRVLPAERELLDVGEMPLANASVYSATKAAVDSITRTLGAELGPKKVRVNAVNPGMVETEGLHATGISGSDFEKQAVAQTPLGRVGRPQDIAPAVVFLASAESAYITGEALTISGGLR